MPGTAMKRLVVFDFDETIISVNSFPLWVWFLIKRSFFNMHYRNIYHIMKVSIKRKIFKISTHAEYKKAIFDIEVNQKWFYDFAVYLERFERFSIFFTYLESNDQIIISSAADQRILRPFIEFLSVKYSIVFSDILGATYRDCQFIMNYRQEKVTNLIDRGLLNDGRIDLLFTDSLDDLSCMKISNEIVFVGSKYEFESLSTNEYIRNISFFNI